MSEGGSVKADRLTRKTKLLTNFENANDTRKLMIELSSMYHDNTLDTLKVKEGVIISEICKYNSIITLLTL